MCSGPMTIVKLMLQELAYTTRNQSWYTQPHSHTQKSFLKKNHGRKLVAFIGMQWFSTNIVVSESADKTSIKVCSLLPANPALPMVEIAVLLVVKKC